jgi:transglutaminase-like putative cysteine protease
MILEIQHETRLQYSQPVTEWLAEFRVEPVSDEGQSCQSFHLSVSQPVSVSKYRDGFGNQVHNFNLLAPNLEVVALAASVVQTHPRRNLNLHSDLLWPLDPGALPLAAVDCLALGGPVRYVPKLQPLLDLLQPRTGMRIVDAAMQTSRYIKNMFSYATAVTNASSPIDDVLEMGMGVCQDFAHLMIAILRSFGIPARYVSGYLHRPGKESQSHAWVEVWLGSAGWFGIDPTNDVAIDEHFVKVAVGRNYADVPPNKGVYRGIGEEKIFARVESRELDRLPTLSWRDQLPPLNVPLTMVLANIRKEATTEEEEEQQQQQQQQ